MREAGRDFNNEIGGEEWGGGNKGCGAGEKELDGGEMRNPAMVDTEGGYRERTWWRVLGRPREAFAARQAANPRRPVLGMAAMMGMGQVANAPFLYPPEAEKGWEVLVWIAVVGVPVGWGLAWGGGWVAALLATRLLRGRGDARAGAQALAWGALPVTCLLPLWVILILAGWGPGFLEGLAGWRPVFAAATLGSVYVGTGTLGAAFRLPWTGALAVLALTVSALSLPLGVVMGR